MIYSKCAKFVVKNARAFSKLSYYKCPGEDPLRKVTFGQVIEESASKYADRYSLISRHQNKRLTFKQTLEEADKLAAGLKKLGLEKGDRFGVWAPNLVESYLVKLACARAGLIMVAINPLYQPSEMEYCINKVGIKGIMCPSKLKTQNYYDHLKTIAPEIEECKPGKLKSAKMPSLENVIIIDEKNLRGTFNYEDIVNSATSQEINSIKSNQHLIDTDDPYCILFTSGSTGRSKAAILKHFSVVNSGFFTGKRLLGISHDIVCVPVPFFHVYGLVICIVSGLIYGSTSVLPSAIYDPVQYLEAIKEEKCTTLHGIPTMYVDLVQKQLEKQEPISPEKALYGGASCPPYLLRKMVEVLNLKSTGQGYGLTETAGVVFQSMPGDCVEVVASTAGYLQEHLEAKVVDSKDNTVPFGSPGELCIRGFCNMIGYWDDKEKTKEVLSEDGWFKTGDQCVLQENGYGVIVGRLKDIIIRGGENIFPKEIEEHLITHPDIIDAYVIGVPHERLGEEVCACIRTNKDVNITVEDIRKFCEGKFANFKIPSKVVTVEEFPKTSSGKVQKFKLVDLVVNKAK